MHPEVQDWAARIVAADPTLAEATTALDIGGRDVNGSIHHLFPAAFVTTLDDAVGEGVDMVADARVWEPNGQWELVICTEVLEHVDGWPGIIGTAYKALELNGRLILTAAAPPRAPHSGIDGWDLREGEHYENIDPGMLHSALFDAGFVDIHVEHNEAHGDVYAIARRPDPGEPVKTSAFAGQA